MYYTLHMSMGKRVRERQPEMWVATTNFPTAASHPFYTRLNEWLAEHHDDFLEGQCQPFYAEIMGRPGLPPYDPDARITKMKDGRTHLAHKAEHAVDLETGAIVGVTLQGADEGDTTTIQETLPEAAEQFEAVAAVTA